MKVSLKIKQFAHCEKNLFTALKNLWDITALNKTWMNCKTIRKKNHSLGKNGAIVSINTWLDNVLGHTGEYRILLHREETEEKFTWFDLSLYLLMCELLQVTATVTVCPPTQTWVTSMSATWLYWCAGRWCSERWQRPWYPSVVRLVPWIRGLTRTNTLIESVSPLHYRTQTLKC